MGGAYPKSLRLGYGSMRTTTTLGFATYMKEDAVGDACRAVVNELLRSIDSLIKIASMMETSFGSRFQWTVQYSCGEGADLRDTDLTSIDLQLARP
jgi:hypothetical protein